MHTSLTADKCTLHCTAHKYNLLCHHHYVTFFRPGASEDFCLTGAI